MINLGTQQLGNKLVRTFETKDGIRRAVTEVVDGKTFTHIFDQEGLHITSRVKTISTEQVGDKTVRTIDKFIDPGLMFKVKRKTVNNVYRDNKFLGSRKTIKYIGDYSKVEKKCANSPISQLKNYGSSGMLIDRYEIDPSGHTVSTHWANNLGLPMPKQGADNIYKGLSLRQMRDRFFSLHPQETYTDSERLAQLNNVDTSVILSPINDMIAELTNKLNSKLNK